MFILRYNYFSLEFPLNTWHHWKFSDRTITGGHGLSPQQSSASSRPNRTGWWSSAPDVGLCRLKKRNLGRPRRCRFTGIFVLCVNSSTPN